MMIVFVFCEQVVVCTKDSYMSRTKFGKMDVITHVNVHKLQLDCILVDRSKY